MNRETIKIMPDYDCFPLWKIGNKSVENIAPQQLPISDNLKSLILSWQRKFDLTLNRKDPLESGFRTHLEEKLFEDEGIIIWKQMKIELGDLYDVKYFSVTRNRIL